MVLFAISLALSTRNRDQQVDPATSWFNKVKPSQAVEASEISALSGSWTNGQWTLPNTLREASLAIAPSKSKRTIRSVKLSLQQGEPFEIRFIPRPDQEEPAKSADAEATPLQIKKLEPGRPPIQLTILQHGGTLVARRLGAGTGQAVFKLE